MTERDPSRYDGPTRYQIVVRGELGERFASAFGGMTVNARCGETRIIGDVLDQAQLHGLLDRIRALGIELVSVAPLPDEAAGPQPGEGPLEGGPPMR